MWLWNIAIKLTTKRKVTQERLKFKDLLLPRLLNGLHVRFPPATSDKIHFHSVGCQPYFLRCCYFCAIHTASGAASSGTESSPKECRLNLHFNGSWDKQRERCHAQSFHVYFGRVVWREAISNDIVFLFNRFLMLRIRFEWLENFSKYPWEMLS